MKISELYNALNELYPTSLSCPWDNDGLMCCPDKDREVKKVLVSLDATEAAISYAAEVGFDTILCHHPLIFKGIKALNEYDVVSRRVLSAVKGGISVISLHTRLDAGVGGVNDTLASLLELSNISSFGDDEAPTLGRIGYTSLETPEELCALIKEKIGVEKISAYICRPIKRVAVLGGSGGSLIPFARLAGADTFVTGECGYNHALDAVDDGLNIILCGHYFTEMPVCEKLYSLARDIAGAECEIFRTVPELCF